MAKSLKIEMQTAKEGLAGLFTAGAGLNEIMVQGETIEEIVKNVQEAIDRYIEALAEEETENRLSR